MSSDWQDPFAEDAAARERAARRAEREQRRREEVARESLGERVREELDRPTATPPDSPPPVPPVPPVPPSAPGPSSSPPSRSVTARRRAAALIGLGLLIAAIAGVGAYISHRRGAEAPVAEAPKARKTIKVTIPEGYDRTQIAGVAKKAGLSGDYMKATDSVNGFGLEEYGAGGAPSLEGLLFPATYELYKGSSVDSLVKKQVEAFKQNLSQVDLDGAKSRGYTPYEVDIVASMIEREIAVPEERKLAASVIYNRLDQGTPLGIDATIRFEDHNYSGQLLESRLTEDTPYNTRTNTGLPPGPIGNPGLASLQAAADPAETDYFYFVVKPGTCNEHVFVKTQAEFDAAEQAYQDALIAKGGSPTEC